MKNNYQPIIGLEIHVELKTKTKMFCSCPNEPYEKHPNINVCPVCLGHPGVLPTINKEGVKNVLKTGLALNGEIADFSRFDRKHYFYPDLPKGYQISQYQHPLVKGGYLEIPTKPKLSSFAEATEDEQIPNFKKIRIRRIHLEEDTGSLIHPVRNTHLQALLQSHSQKSVGGEVSNGVHKSDSDYSLVDYNRVGVPLMELVTEPDISLAGEARKFAEEFQLILRYLDVSEAQMEKGQMRVEANISLLPPKSQISSPTFLSENLSGQANLPSRAKIHFGAEQESQTNYKSQILNSKLGIKVEIKNLNSFRAVEKAIEYEIKRQMEILEKGEKVKQETRGWDENKEVTFSQRSKEEAEDYRYFPEPDLPPMTELGTWSLELGKTELPFEKRKRFKKEYKIKDEAIEILVSDKNFADYFEKVVSELTAWLAPLETESLTGFETEKNSEREITPLNNLITLAVNYLTTDLLSLIKEKELPVKELLITPENFSELIKMLGENKISSRAAKDILLQMFRTGEDPSVLAEKMNLIQMSEEKELEETAKRVVAANPEAAEDFKKGKANALQFLVGQMMKQTKGKANPQISADLLTKILERV